MSSTTPRFFALALALGALLATTQGCSVIGLGVGAATPRYEGVPEQPSHSWMEELHTGDSVRVRTRHSTPPSTTTHEAYASSSADWIEGRYEGIQDQKLLVALEGGSPPMEIPLQDVTDVRVRRGSQWARGLIIGAVIDAVVAGVVVAATVGHMDINLGSGNWSGAAPTR